MSEVSTETTGVSNEKKRQILGGFVALLVVIGVGLVVRYNNSDSTESNNAIPSSLEGAEKAIEADPLNAQLWYVKGVIQQIDLGNPEGAVESYNRAIELSPNFLSALFNRGIALRGLGRLDEAKLDFTRIVGLKRGEAPRALFNLGLIAIDQGDSELGERYLQRAYEQDPSLRP